MDIGRFLSVRRTSIIFHNQRCGELMAKASGQLSVSRQVHLSTGLTDVLKQKDHIPCTGQLARRRQYWSTSHQYVRAKSE
jgi:hypothetical protein